MWKVTAGAMGGRDLLGPWERPFGPQVHLSRDADRSRGVSLLLPLNRFSLVRDHSGRGVGEEFWFFSFEYPG